MDHRVTLSLSRMPLFRSVDYCVACLPFVHRDRIIDHHVLIYITKGVMYICEDGTEYAVRAGEILILKAGVHHWGYKTIPAGTEWYFVHFFCDCAPADDSVRSAADPRSYSFLTEDYGGVVTLPKLFQVHDGERLSAMLEEMKALFYSPDPLRHAYLSAKLSSFLLVLYENKRTSASPDHADEIVQELVLFLKSNVNRSLSSREIAAHMHMSYQYLCSIFKRKNRMGILAYHTNLRIAEACRLLRETRLNISEISDSIGYSNPFYFSSVFKKITGKSPRSYLAEATGGGGPRLSPPD